MNKNRFICDNCKNEFFLLTELSKSGNRDYDNICIYCYNDDLENKYNE